MKESLKEMSPMSRWLNDRINPAFNRIRDSIVTQEEIREAKRIAREATHDLGIEAEKGIDYRADAPRENGYRVRSSNDVPYSSPK
jgi:hypothetical protein